jgi:hypothetical protein
VRFASHPVIATCASRECARDTIALRCLEKNYRQRHRAVTADIAQVA